MSQTGVTASARGAARAGRCRSRGIVSTARPQRAGTERARPARAARGSRAARAAGSYSADNRQVDRLLEHVLTGHAACITWSEKHSQVVPGANAHHLLRAIALVGRGLAFGAVVQVEHQVIVRAALALGHVKRGQQHALRPDSGARMRGSSVFAIASNGSPTRHTRGSRRVDVARTRAGCARRDSGATETRRRASRESSLRHDTARPTAGCGR